MAEETQVDVQDAIDRAPDILKKFADAGNKLPAEDLFTGEMAQFRDTIKQKGIARMSDGTHIAADFDAEGNVIAMAAAVSRTPAKSEVYLRDDVPDLQTDALSRADKIKLYRKLYKKEGAINNAIKKKASLISQEGDFVVRAAKQGRGKSASSSASDLLTLLTFWAENVNSASRESAVTGSRGIRQVIRRGARQAMIEGDLFMREEWSNITVPQLAGKKFKLPMFLFAMPAEEVEIAEDFEALGVELYYWVPSSAKMQAITNPRDPNVKEIMQRVVSPELINELKKNRKVLLSNELMIHLKNAGVDHESYGDSDVEPSTTDLAYARALKSLDFVTIDSLINRMLVIKIGDPNPDSTYHNLAIAQKRVNVFKNLITTLGPNMMILWAGHDIETTDIGAHDKVMDTDARQERARSDVKLAAGVPDPLLTGNADGGNAVAWAGFIALGAVAAELQEEWTQALTQLGQIIAEQNNFKDVDLVWQFAHSLLADVEANAKVMIQGFDRGVVSKGTLLDELNLDYNVEKARKIEEEPDEDLFMPPMPMTTNPGGNQGIDPKKQPGKPSDKGNPKKVGPERKREDKKVK